MMSKEEALYKVVADLKHRLAMVIVATGGNLDH